MTRKEALALGRRIMRHCGYGDAQIGAVLPHWADGFKRGFNFGRAQAAADKQSKGKSK